MIKRTISISLLLFFMAFFTCTVFSSPYNPSKKDTQLNEDLNKVWPFIQTIKVEYELVLAQLEIMGNDSLKMDYMAHYEDYVKNAYFDQLIKLNIRQVELLLLLIDRELGKTPYELLRDFRNPERADFWEKFAKFLGADMNKKYDSNVYPEIEENVLKLSGDSIPEYIPPK
jgi:hypothetical protein